MTKALGEVTRLTLEERAAAVSGVLSSLAWFVEDVCGRCPVACLNHPRADAEEPYFAAEHPALG